LILEIKFILHKSNLFVSKLLEDRH